MTINELLNESDISLSKKKSPINVIKPIGYKNGILQLKVKRVLAYEVLMPTRYTYYKNLNIFAKVASKEKNTYNFYFADIGWELLPPSDGKTIRPDGMTLDEFFENFKGMSLPGINHFIQMCEKDNNNARIFGDVRNIEPGVYPKPL